MDHVMVRRRGLRIAVALAVALSVFAFADGPAHACSCAIGDPRDALHASDAAFVGALESKSDVTDQKAIYTFSVETSVKGDLGASVDVESAAYGAACGFEVRVGRRIGILLRLQGDGDWTGGLCTQIDPDVLIAAGQPLPAPDGVGAIRTIVGGNFGEARILALDEMGRILGYGDGDGDVLAVSMCPGMQRFVEAVSLDGVGSLGVRETSTLEIVRDVPLITGRFPSIYQVACLSEDGGVLGAVTTRGGETQVHVVRGERDRVAFEAERVRAWFQRQRVYATVASSLVRVALWGGDHRVVADVPAGLSSPAVSRDERHVAGVRYGGSRPGRPPTEVVVVRAGDGARRGFALRGWNDVGDVHWADNRTLVYLPGGGDDDRAHVLLLPRLERIGGFRGWQTGTSFIRNGCAGGVGWGTLFAACLPDGPISTQPLLGPETFAVTPVSGNVVPNVAAP